MYTKQKFNFLYFFFISLILTLSCTTYHIKTPPSGKTYTFVNKSTNTFKENTKYDFSKIKKNYGLVIFTYEIMGITGSNLTGIDRQTKTGIRIWEKKFKDDEWEIKQEIKTIKLWESNTFAPNYNFSGPSFSTSTASVKIEVTFYKNRIVYGGKLIASKIDGKFEVQKNYDEDCSAFLETYKDQIDDIRIDTVLVNYIPKY